jgi:hypothetical protein
LVYGTEGTALLDGNAYTIFDKKNKIVKQIKANEAVDKTNTVSATGLDLDQLHFANFIEAVRNGTSPNCPADVGHNSVTLLHLGNIAWRVGRELHCDPTNGRILKDRDAMKFWRRDYQRGWEPKV